VATSVEPYFPPERCFVVRGWAKPEWEMLTSEGLIGLSVLPS
jgi:hypothetical protein